MVGCCAHRSNQFMGYVLSLSRLPVQFLIRGYIGTGRPIAIADNQFDTAVPSCDALSGEDLTHAPPRSFVYGHLCRLVQLRGKMGDVLNNLVKRKPDQYPVDMELSELQSQMTSFYHALPPSLVFNIHNFRRFSTHNQAAVFLLLHVMFHSVITLLHRPSLLRSFTPDVALPLANNVDLSRSVSCPSLHLYSGFASDGGQTVRTLYR